MRWTQEKDVPKLRYNSAKDPKGRGWHYIWEGGGFGVQVYATGLRKWIQCGNAWNPKLEKRQPYFRSLGNLDQVKLADARTAAGRVKADAKDGTLGQPEKRRRPAHSPAPPTPAVNQGSACNLAETTLNEAITYYVDNRNCAPSSKYTLAVELRKHLADWLQKPLLTIDTIMLQQRYKLVLKKVKARGDELDSRYESMSAKERLKHAPPGYHNGVKTAHDIIEGFGRVYRYWTTKHQTLLQRAGVIVPICPTTALIDDIEPQPQRVKSVPPANLRRLLLSFPTYPGNRLHPLLMRLLLASGMRVGIAMGCKKEYIKSDRIVIPAHAERSKVRWKKRHLDHMAYISPITPEIEEILREIERVAPEYGDSDVWLFPSRTANSGHMECEQNAVLRLREHSGARFTAHQFRHNVGSTAEDLGYSKPEIQELLGQARGTVTDRYIDERVARYRRMLIAVNAAIRELLAVEEHSGFNEARTGQGRSATTGSNMST